MNTLSILSYDFIDLKVVITDGSYPTKSNSTDLDPEAHGRGSWVFFNEATMYMSSETRYGTIKNAKAHGHSGTTDYGRDAQQAFTTFGSLLDINHLI